MKLRSAIHNGENHPGSSLPTQFQWVGCCPELCVVAHARRNATSIAMVRPPLQGAVLALQVGRHLEADFVHVAAIGAKAAWSDLQSRHKQPESQAQVEALASLCKNEKLKHWEEW